MPKRKKRTEDNKAGKKSSGSKRHAAQKTSEKRRSTKQQKIPFWRTLKPTKTKGRPKVKSTHPLEAKHTEALVRNNPELARAWNLLQEREDHFRSRFDSHVATVAKLPTKERAEAWLRFVLEDPDDYGDLEALVYLVSQGEDCSEYISRTISQWKGDEEAAIAACSRGAAISSGGNTFYSGSMPEAEAAKIEERPSYQLSDFWQHSNRGYRVIEATMLRVVHWCAIGGFEPWWRRVAKEATQDFLTDPPEAPWLIWWLLVMARADKALATMPKALSHSLDVVRLSSRWNSKPWLMNTARPVKSPNAGYEYPTLTNLLFTSCLAFCLMRLGKDSDDLNLAAEAVGVLEKHQRADGSWPSWSDGTNGSIEATAIAIHAVALQKPPSAQRLVTKAVNWLKAQQEPGGYWTERSCPDPAFLTVLVLDAMELATGGSRVTFGRSSISAAPTAVGQQRRFRVALSFPGEVRNRVETVASALANRFGEDKVFYDRFHEPDLARPNLDSHLQEIYHKESDFIVVWLCAQYEKKDWCGLEWRALRDLIKRRRTDDIMFVRLDDAEITGVFSIDGYIDGRRYTDVQIADAILKRLSERER